MSEEANVAGALTPQARAELVQRLMKRQAGLSLRVAAVFVVLLIGIPLFNLYAPEKAATSEFGFTFAWLFLGVVFFPITWLLSAFFVTRSDALEAEIARSEREHLSTAKSAEGAKS